VPVVAGRELLAIDAVGVVADAVEHQRSDDVPVRVRGLG
jgi:hypothetical protein